MIEKRRFFRFCINIKCGKRFTPESKFQRLCKECYERQHHENLKKLISFKMNISQKRKNGII